MTENIVPFSIDVGPTRLDDLADRLGRTRWPERETVDDWSQGIPLAYVQDVCRYWMEEYDWQATEDRLNAIPQFKTELDGLGIHFLHIRSPERDALPLVLTHGWPGSIVEFLKVIGPLTDPARHGGDSSDAFHVVCPSLPGYGFSDKPERTGWNVPRIATAWAELMGRLGYERYGAQGGDWGAAVTTAIGRQDTAHCIGIHLNMVPAWPRRADMENLSEAESASLAALQEHDHWGTGYSKQQSTRPQTLGYGLVDSPAGQAAWILEKFWAWTDCDGHPENVFTRDQLITNVMTYWVTQTITSSARLYWELMHSEQGAPEFVGVPTGLARFPKEMFRFPRAWIEQRYNVTYWSEQPRGGHFAAMEQPELFVDDVRSFFRTVR